MNKYGYIISFICILTVFSLCGNPIQAKPSGIDSIKNIIQASEANTQPDLLIKVSDELDTAYQTDNIYQQSPSDTQIKNVTTIGDPVTFNIKLQNDYSEPESYCLKAQGNTDTNWTVQYLLNTYSRMINTYAGGGISMADGTDAKSFDFNDPYGQNNPLSLVYDHQGNLYIGGFNVVWRMDTSGKISKIAGDGNSNYEGDGGLATQTAISPIYAMAVDSKNNLYICDFWNGRVRRIDASTGIITTVAGSKSGSINDNDLATNTILDYPEGITIDKSDNLYISETSPDRVRKVDAITQRVTTVLGGSGGEYYNGDGIPGKDANVGDPSGLALDSNGNLYVCDSENCRIRKIDALTGIVSTVAGNGSTTHSGDGGLATKAGIAGPVGICFDKKGNLYLTEGGLYVRKVDKITGIITTVAGNGSDDAKGTKTGILSDDGKPALLAQLDCCRGITTREDDSLLVTDEVDERIRLIDSDDIQDQITAEGGYTTTAIPAGGSVVIDATLIPSNTLTAGSEKSFCINAYLSSDDTVVLDSVEGVATKIIPGITYATPGGLLKGGWNLVSLPADPVNTDVPTIFTGIDLPNSSFQYWNNNVDPCVFQSYGFAFGWTGPVVRGASYWFMQAPGTTDKIISYQGIEPTDDFVMTIPAHANAPYWISTGTPFPNVISADAIQFKDIKKQGDTWLAWKDAYSIADITLRIVDSSMQGWDNAVGSFVRIAPSAFATTNDKTQFDPWWGYWLLINDSNEIQIKFPKPTQ